MKEAEQTTIKDIVQTQLLSCAPTDSILTATRKMAAQRCSSILILDNDQVLGIWTENDALKHDFSKIKSHQTAISEVMSSPVKSVPDTLSLEEVSSEFRRDGFRHYLVEDAQGQRLGIISQTDVVLKYSLEYYLVPRNISSVIQAGVPILDFDHPLADAITLMREHRVDALIINLPNHEQGIITERDIIKAIAADDDNPQVIQYATKGLITINEHQSLYKAKQFMLARKIRHLGVVNDNQQLISIINLDRILEGMLNSYLEELRHVVMQQKTALEQSSAHLHLAHKVITSTLEGITITDANGLIQSCNPAFTRITGYTELEVLGKNPSILKSGRHEQNFYAAMWQVVKEKGNWQGEIWNRKKNGDIYPQFLSISVIRDENSNEITHYSGIFNDISQAKSDQEKIHQLAYYDPLTGLANRRLFFDRLEQQIATSIRHKNLFALIYLDLDKFKPINDTYGHAAGDFLLVQTAKRLHSVLREADTIARIGGDEFVVILTDLDSDTEQAKQQISQVKEKIETQLSLPCSFETHELAVAVSIGIALFNGSNGSAEDLLKQADNAMYRVKAMRLQTN